MKKILIAISALLIFASCAKETPALQNTEGTLQTIIVNIEAFNGDAATKTAITPTGGFTWTANDQIGIYPLGVDEPQTSQQIVFKVNSGDASSTTFTGTGWGLITTGDYSYFSYYPYSASTTHAQTVVTYSDNLTQIANDSAAHLGVNDFLYAPAITPTSSQTAAFTFHHLSALVEFKLLVPVGDRSKTFEKVEVTAAEDLFTTTGKYNPSTTTTATPPTITDKEYTNKLTLNLNSIAPDSDGYIHAYFLIAPAAVNGKKLNVRLVSTGGVSYVGTKTPESDILSNDHRIFKIDDMSLYEVVDLSANGTANCYIVPESGKYGFLANVKGNGVDPLTNDSEGSSIAIESGYYAEVIWETVNTKSTPSVGTIINNDVKIDGNYIVFTATGTQGNALISLKNGDNEIVWSWHIWSTNVDLVSKIQTYNGYDNMDRFLGALSAETGNPGSIGLDYQWGRPFPFVGTAEFSNSRMETTNSSVWKYDTSSESVGTLGYSRANPTTFIMSSNNWYYDGNPDFWGSEKTMYDPCPVGWKVSPSSIWTNFGTNTSKSSDDTGIIYNPATAYFPHAGYIANKNGVLTAGGTGGVVWGSNQRYDKPGEAYCLLYTGTGGPNNFSKAMGFSVRPCVDNK